MNLAPRLAVARIRATRGAGVLDAMAVIAFTISAWLALTVAGGTWMFYRRWSLHGALADPSWGDVAPAYVALAGFACALLVVPIFGLGGGAARLGARGRARRLASLRLIGMTSGEVVRMSVVETVVQAVAGVALGSVLFAASLPAWQLVAFQQQHIKAAEMLLPWWLWLAVVGALLLLAVASTVIGLRRVTISPLGVARDQSPNKLKVWRLAAVVVLVAGFLIYSRFTNIASMVGLITTVGFLAVVVGSINLVGPWLLQLVSRPRTRTASVPRLLAARRILDDPRGAWRNVSSLALLGFMAGFVVTMPVTTTGAPSDVYSDSFVRDIQTGVAITLGVGLVLAAMATLMTQASQVFDRAQESIALDRMGVPSPVHASVRRSLVLVPLAVALGTSVPLGFLLSTVVATEMESFPVVGVVMLAATITLGFLLSLGAAEACRPLQAGVLSQQQRRND
ncbi:MAG: FtsX-like permease family protein [Arachnia sp.]